MSDQYPKMLYRPVSAGTEGAVEIEGLNFETRVVADFDEEEVASDDGWARYDERDTSAAETLTAEKADPAALGATEDAAVALLRDELLAADEKLRTRETEISLANDRIVALEAENAELIEKLAALDKDGDGAPGGSLPNDPPALTGKTKAELLEIAAAEGVSVEAGSTNADIIAAIELNREPGNAGA